MDKVCFVPAEGKTNRYVELMRRAVSAAGYCLSESNSFSDVLSAVMGSIEETNDLQNSAEQEEIRFALGESDNTHDLLVAETKASVALQYTVAVRDKIIDAYKQLMQM